jgi:hypothetical protein
LAVVMLGLRFSESTLKQEAVDSVRSMSLNVRLPQKMVVRNYFQNYPSSMQHLVGQHSYCMVDVGKSYPFRLRGGSEARP